MITIEIVLYLFLSLLSIILLVLILPIYYVSSGEKQDKTYLNVIAYGPLKWFYFVYSMQGLNKTEKHLSVLGIKINIESRKGHEKEEKGKKKKEKKKKRRKKNKKFGKDFFKKILKATQNFWKHVKPRLLKIEGRYGFGDPYQTGLVCAIINCVAPYGDKYDINLTPIFVDEVIEGKYKIKGRIVPIIILWILIRIFVIPHLKFNNILIKRTRDV